MMYLMKNHRERAYKLISRELKLYAFAFFILLSVNIIKFLLYRFQKTLYDDGFDVGLYLHLEDYYQIFNLFWILTVLCLKKPIDYVLEISLLRSLSTLSIHQRRIKEDGKLCFDNNCYSSTQETRTTENGQSTTNTLAELEFPNNEDYQSESSSYVGSENNDDYSDY